MANNNELRQFVIESIINKDETFIDDDIALGSLSSGGRYENLT